MFSSFGADRPARVSSGPPLVACGSRTVLPDKGDPRAVKQSQQLPAPDWLRTHLPPPALPDHPAAKQYLPITQEMPPAKAVSRAFKFFDSDGATAGMSDAGLGGFVVAVVLPPLIFLFIHL